MSLTDSHKNSLRRLIGKPVIYQGIPCVVIELLEEEATLVLAETNGRSALQSNQYGDAGRHVAESFTLPLLDEDGSGEFHPEFCKLSLLPCD